MKIDQFNKGQKWAKKVSKNDPNNESTFKRLETCDEYATKNLACKKKGQPLNYKNKQFFKGVSDYLNKYFGGKTN